ncbi:MAG TPA: HAD family hydrolase [Planctomycetota bacterium]|jgi:putative hydrolase of the HAD superfamily|nr:HAD family hydrolase [Planctomycetota bacterium]OQC19529.1 MAG: Phosphoglycolate phosphatase [Planctomycetes bacterium ADurb.Bin069]HNR99898.1 HAD family hydrolase [Planctomycetota bacterium]HNU26414.1 HAD family hydrolase [Planctomycetota bacterium]HOE31235.1 HAD family hydrolase [Planctomycetota bacterium]
MWTEDRKAELARELIARIRALSAPRRPVPAPVAARGGRLPGIRAVFFDVYNTMLACAFDETRADGRAFAQACAALGFAAAPAAAPRHAELFRGAIEAEHRESRGRGIAFPEVDIRAVWRDVLARLHAEGLFPRRPDEDDIARLAIEYECRVDPAWPVPGLADLLEDLAGRGIKLGIVSNAQFYTPLVLEAFLGDSRARRCFDPVLCVWSYRLKEAKPSPRLASAALDALRTEYGIAPEEAVMVGNSPEKDILPAAALGCAAVLCTADAGPEALEPEACAKAAAVIGDLRDLAAIL